MINKYTHFQFARRVWIITRKVDWGDMYERDSIFWCFQDVFYLLWEQKKPWWIAGSVFTRHKCFPLAFLSVIVKRLVLFEVLLVSFVQFSVSNLCQEIRQKERYLMRKHISKASEWMKGCFHKSIYMFAEVLFALIVIYFFLPFFPPFYKN